MNWYKKAQSLEIDDNPGGSYLDYGHDIYNRSNDGTELHFVPNFMWYYINGNIDVEEETVETKGHGNVPRWDGIDSGNYYGGRYSGRTRTITIVPPIRGTGKFRGIPKSLQYLLKKAFPDALRMNVYR